MFEWPHGPPHPQIHGGMTPALGARAQARPDSTLVICAKSTWQPAIRREHAFAQIAAGRGHRVAFVERAAHVRQVTRRGAGAYVRALAPSGVAGRVDDGVTAVRRSVIVPAHHDRLAERANALTLGRAVRSSGGRPNAAVVVNLPWDWPAVRAFKRHRRVLDLADDWAELHPTRADRIRRLYAEIAEEADAIIVVNEDLAEHFPNRDVVLVRNGVAPELLASPRASPNTPTMVYAGTLSPRFDHDLVRRVLARLPTWTLTLVGPCQYAGYGTKPSPELLRLLDSSDRVSWIGSRPRADIARIIDAAAVAILPNDARFSAGQDSMKLFDYAARGRPIVTTRWHPDLERLGPPGMSIAGDDAEFATAVAQALVEAPGLGERRRAWAASNTWERRWMQWSEVVFGRR